MNAISQKADRLVERLLVEYYPKPDGTKPRKSGGWKIQQRELGGWFDHVEHTDDVETVQRYATERKAQADLEEFLNDVRDAYEEGLMDSAYDPEDYRVVPWETPSPSEQ